LATFVIYIDEAIELLIHKAIVKNGVSKPITSLQNLTLVSTQYLHNIHKNWKMALSGSIMSQRTPIIISHTYNVKFVTVEVSIPVLQKTYKLEVSMMTGIKGNSCTGVGI